MSTGIADFAAFFADAAVGAGGGFHRPCHHRDEEPRVAQRFEHLAVADPASGIGVEFLPDAGVSTAVVGTELLRADNGRSSHSGDSTA